MALHEATETYMVALNFYLIFEFQHAYGNCSYGCFVTFHKDSGFWLQMLAFLYIFPDILSEYLCMVEAVNHAIYYLSLLCSLLYNVSFQLWIEYL